jgi:hypothetical protein
MVIDSHLKSSRTIIFLNDGSMLQKAGQRLLTSPFDFLREPGKIQVKGSQTTAQAYAHRFLCSMAFHSSDSRRAESCLSGSLTEPSMDWRIQLDLLCRLSLAVSIIQIHRRRLL